MTIQDIQEDARRLAPIFGDKTPERRMLYLATEFGEFSREVLRVVQGSQEADKENLGMEIYDIIWNMCDLANMLDVDLADCFEKKREQNKTRWPHLR